MSGRNGEAAISAAVPLPAIRPAASVALPGSLTDPAECQRPDRRCERQRGERAGRCWPCARVAAAPDHADRPRHRDVDRGLERDHQRHRDPGGDEQALPGSVEPADRAEATERNRRRRRSRRQQGQAGTGEGNDRNQPRGPPPEERRGERDRAPTQTAAMTSGFMLRLRRWPRGASCARQAIRRPAPRPASPRTR